MKYIFFGTPEFSAQCLSVILENDLAPLAVVCNPDRPVGRKKIMTAPPVKIMVEAWNAKHDTDIKIFQPEKLDRSFQNTLEQNEPDFFLIFAYNKIFKKEILAIPQRGAIGIHPSLLPRYRGPSPFQTALLDGEKQTGVTLYLLDEGVDSGPIIAVSEPIAITKNDDARDLGIKLAEAGARLAIATLPNFIAGKIEPKPQNESAATYTKKFTTQDGFIEPDDLTAGERGQSESDIETAHDILHKIQAFTPEPGAWTKTSDDKRLKLLKAAIKDNRLVLAETQTEGERPKTVLRKAAPNFPL